MFFFATNTVSGMDYFFENLGDERFQQFAQSLISAAFPNAQCLPVGQPDGGRDAFITEFLHHRSGRKEFTVFQVQFSRNPNTKDARGAILGLIKTELTKVEQLKALGATSYYLITNVSGTSHLGTGSIDKTNEELTTTFGIPSYCWWRDDLVARANLNSNLKWSFPEIMRGTDVLQLLVEASLNENAVARNQALRSYLALQYRDDEEVRFKQVELQNKLLDLFVDLPVERSNAALGASARPSRNISGVSDADLYVEEVVAEEVGRIFGFAVDSSTMPQVFC